MKEHRVLYYFRKRLKASTNTNLKIKQTDFSCSQRIIRIKEIKGKELKKNTLYLFDVRKERRF